MRSNEIEQSTVDVVEDALLAIAPATLSTEGVARDIGTTETRAETLIDAVDQHGERVRVDSVDALGGNIWIVEEVKCGNEQ